MFGDNEAYFNKFMTYVRTRPRESQKLEKNFMSKSIVSYYSMIITY